jgi:hypothetical protein
MENNNNMLTVVEKSTLPTYYKKLVPCLVDKNRMGVTDALDQFRATTNCCNVVFGGYDLQAVVKSGVPIGHMAKEIGKGNLVKLLCILIADLCGAYNVVRNMSSDQILDYAVEQVEDCPHYHFEDYVIFFDRAKRGFFGQPFDRIDRGILDDWFEQYHEVRKKAMWAVQDEHKTGVKALPRMTTASDPLENKLLDLGGAISELKKGLQNDK